MGVKKEKEHPQGITPRTRTHYTKLLEELQPYTQNHILLSYLIRNRSITPDEAWNKLGIYRLSGRICDLRGKGVEITTLRIPVLDRFGCTKYIAKYVLDEVV